MTTRLSDEMRAAIQACPGEPLCVTDEVTNEVYYLLDAQAFARLCNERREQGELSRGQLKKLILEGVQSAEIPAEEVFDRLRNEASQLAARHP